MSWKISTVVVEPSNRGTPSSDELSSEEEQFDVSFGREKSSALGRCRGVEQRTMSVVGSMSSSLAFDRFS